MTKNNIEEKVKSLSALVRINADDLRSLVREVVLEEVSKLTPPTAPPLEVIYTVQEAADRAKVSPKTIRRWIDDGLLDNRDEDDKKGLIRIKESDLMAYIFGPRKSKRTNF